MSRRQKLKYEYDRSKDGINLRVKSKWKVMKRSVAFKAKISKGIIAEDKKQKINRLII